MFLRSYGRIWQKKNTQKGLIEAIFHIAILWKNAPIKSFRVVFFAKSSRRTLKTLFKHIYRFRFSRNRLDGLELVHYSVQMPLEALNIFRSCGYRHRMIINFGENDRIDKMLNCIGLDQTFKKTNWYPPFNVIHWTYLVMNQYILL